MEPTIPMDEFLVKYRKDDNEWWRLESGDMQNLFEEAVDRAEAAEAEVERLRAVAEATQAIVDVYTAPGPSAWRLLWSPSPWIVPPPLAPETES